MTIFFGKFVALWKIIAVLTLMLSIAATEMKGQTTCPPEPDCPNDLFQPGPTIIIPSPSGPSPLCDVEIEWCWRIACGIFTDIAITSIKVNVNQCPPYGTSIEEIKDAAMAAIFETYVGNLIPATIPPCDATRPIWRLGIGTCLIATPMQDGRLNIAACGANQCWIRYNVCLDPESGATVVNRLSSFTFGSTCPPDALSTASSIEQFQMVISNLGTCVEYCD